MNKLSELIMFVVASTAMPTLDYQMRASDDTERKINRRSKFKKRTKSNKRSK